MLVAIEETRLVFRRQTRWTDGRVEVAVESKSLRQPSAGDALTVTKAAAAPAAATPEAAASGDEKSEIEKLKAEVERLKALAQSAGARPEAGRP
jgi:hypothetical protein